MYAPEIQSPLSFRHELVPLIHGGHPADCAADMVEDAIGYVGRYSKLRHSRHNGPAEVMKAPVCHA